MNTDALATVHNILNRLFPNPTVKRGVLLIVKELLTHRENRVYMMYGGPKRPFNLLLYELLSSVHPCQDIDSPEGAGICFYEPTGAIDWELVRNALNSNCTVVLSTPDYKPMYLASYTLIPFESAEEITDDVTSLGPAFAYVVKNAL